jgi:hypothetical protein
MRPTQTKDIGQIFAEGTPIDEALKTAAREAVKRHKQAGLPMAEWRDGRVVWVPPEELPSTDQAEGPPDRAGMPGKASTPEKGS